MAPNPLEAAHDAFRYRMAAASTALRLCTLGFVLAGSLLLALLVVLDFAAPGGRGFLIVTPANIDSICYFSTAHSLLFDGDFDLSNQLRVMIPPNSPLPPGSLKWVAVQPASGLPGSPYAIGYSLLAMPFLAAGTVADAATGAPPSGYGRFATSFFAGANVVFLTLGLILSFRWLAQLGLRWIQDSRSAIGWAAVSAGLLVPATALGYYAFTVMSHTASFLATALFLWVWWNRRDSERIRDWAAIGAASGLMALCRWQDVLFLAVLLWHELNRAALRQTLRRPEWWVSRFAGGLAFLAMFLPQMWQWRVIYGSWLTIPQGPQFVEWPPARVLHVLFSSHNGLFFTTPATLAGAAGLLWGLRKDARLFGGLLAAFACQVILVGSLPRHWSGMAFAMRLLISSTPLLAAGFLFLFLNTRRWTRRAVVGWICAGSLFTLLSAVQWRYEFVPRSSPLTFQEAFADKFRLHRAYRCYKDVQRIERAGGAENPQAAARALEEVMTRFGENRVLLDRLRNLYERSGNLSQRNRVQAKLNALSAREMF
ncbi:MAG: hypothetical protein K6T61_03355 [Bryobacteraceae bacterium]|nr:hypothetical protein [Bryobacteraceae bacterium]